MNRWGSERNRNACYYFQQVAAEKGGIVGTAARNHNYEINVPPLEKCAQAFNLLLFLFDSS